MKPVLGVVFGLLLLQGCGEKNNEEIINSIPFENNLSMSASTPMVWVDPEFSSGMGLLLTKKPGKIGLCTSFLISPTLLMTNSHCVEEEAAKTSCKETMAVHIKASNGAEYRRCKKVITKSKLEKGSFLNTDYAIIELDTPVLTASTFKLSREGIIEGDELTVESVDFTSASNGTIVGTRKISKCQAQTGSIFGNFSSAMSSIIPLFKIDSGECRIIQGNSGSPVFNTNNKVVSVVFATKENDIASSKKIEGERNVGLATNLTCLTLGIPELDKNRPEECDDFLKEESTFMEKIWKDVKNRVETKTEKAQNEVKKSLPDSIMFNITTQPVTQTSFRYVAKPICVKDPKNWSAEEKQKIWSEGMLFKKSFYSTLVPKYLQTIKVSFDEFYRPIVDVTLERTTVYKLSLDDIDSLAKNGSIILKENDSSEHHLPICK